MNEIFVRTKDHRLYQINEKSKIRQDYNYILSLTKHGEKVLYHNQNADVIFNRILQEIDRQLSIQAYAFIDMEVIA